MIEVITTTKDKQVLTNSFTYEKYGCVVNHRSPARMAESTFISMCRSTRKKFRLREHEYRNNYYRVCKSCPLRRKIDKGRKIEPPPGIEFITKFS